eukprot:jgi/Bigna1/85360/estExt_fgenesh1_pg.C_30351
MLGSLQNMLNKAKGESAQLNRDKNKVYWAQRYKRYSEHYKERAAVLAKEGDTRAPTYLDWSKYYMERSVDQVRDIEAKSLAILVPQAVADYKKNKDKEDAQMKKEMEKNESKKPDKVEGKSEGSSDKFVTALKVKVPKGLGSGGCFAAKYDQKDVFIVVQPGTKPGTEILFALPTGIEPVAVETTEVKESELMGPQEKEGWLEKTGYVNTSYQKRYFKLMKNASLVYYSEAHSTKEQGSINLNEVTLKAKPPKDDGAPFYFIILFLKLHFRYDQGTKAVGGMASRNMKIKATSQQELDSWITALKSHKGLKLVE